MSSSSKHASNPQRKRALQRVRSGMGKLFRSPQKSRPTRVKKKEAVAGLLRLQALERTLADLLASSDEGSGGEESAMDVDEWTTPLPPAPLPMDCAHNTEHDGPSFTSNEDYIPFDDCPPDYPVQATPLPPKTRRVEPDHKTSQVYACWLELLPSLVLPYLAYFEETYQQPGSPSLGGGTLLGCQRLQCAEKHKRNKILCLYSHHFQEIEVEWCPSSSLHATLVRHGLFPTAPAQPRQAISVDLLSFFKALFERSCDAAYALANALHTHYLRRGFHSKNSNGEATSDPFRKGLTSAMQWHDCLVQQIEKKTHAILQAANTVNPVMSEGKAAPPREQCARILQDRCPACFGGIRFGGKCDIIVSVDGTFNQRHVRSRGDCPSFYHPDYFLSKAFVDEVGEEVEKARKKPAKPRRKAGPQVPDAAIDTCESSHEAGSGSNVKTSLEHFDDGGIMGLVCRHDIPIFLANIDTPGEQQKYAVALLRHLFSMIPPIATVEVLYDVGCVMARSVERYSLFPDDVTKRLTFGTSIMHSYAHEFACQIVHNSRYRENAGLSDGEGTERLWSRLSGLIGITRMCGRRKRIFFLDRQLAAVGAEMRDQLGTTLRRRSEKNVPHHEETAKRALEKVSQTEEELLTMWQQQKDTQLSVRSHAPARIKKELDAILTLQSELEGVEVSLRSTRSVVASLHNASSISSQLLDTLEARQQDIGVQVEELYASLNVHESFPELKGVDLEFIRVLLLARDLKMNIRKKAIGSFNEYDKMNQAQGGGAPIGTKAHQYIRQSIAKRVPTLRRNLRRFNELCSRAKAIYKEEWKIPLPDPLPEDIAKLKADPGLLEDVWISAAPSSAYKWLYDSDIREAMRAVHRKQRCIEEIRRLGVEMDNLCRWFGQEMRSVEIALLLPKNRPYSAVLNHQRSRLMNLKGQWTTRSTAALFESHVSTAETEARHVYAQKVGVPLAQDAPLTWVKPMVSVTVWADDYQEDVFADSEENMADQDDDVFVSKAPPSPKLSEVAKREEEVVDEVHSSDCLSMETEVEIVAEWSDSSNGRPALDEAPRVLQMVQCISPSTARGADFQSKEHVKKDLHLLQRLTGWIPKGLPPLSTTPRVFHVDGRRYVFSEHDTRILSKKSAWLNDDCVNNLAALLQFRVLNSQGPSSKAALCSIFSSYEMSTSSDISRIWSRCEHLVYWKKSIWIVPIHQGDHWVLAIVQHRTPRIYLFDSFNNTATAEWKSLLKKLISFATALVQLAVSNGHTLAMPSSPWDVRSLTSSCLQTDGNSCGLWTLATVAAVLEGRHVTGLKQEDMVAFRQKLYALVNSLPIYP